MEWGETAVPGRGQSHADIQKVLCPEGDSHRQTYRKFCARKGTVTGRHTESSVPKGTGKADIQKVLCPEGDSHRQTYRKFCARKGTGKADIQKVLCPEGDSHRQTYRKFCAQKGIATGKHTESSALSSSPTSFLTGFHYDRHCGTALTGGMQEQRSLISVF